MVTAESASRKHRKAKKEEIQQEGWTVVFHGWLIKCDDWPNHMRSVWEC